LIATSGSPKEKVVKPAGKLPCAKKRCLVGYYPRKGGVEKDPAGGKSLETRKVFGKRRKGCVKRGHKTRNLRTPGL